MRHSRKTVQGISSLTALLACALSLPSVAQDKPATMERSPAHIADLIQKMGASDVTVRWLAIQQSASIGAAATPQLLDAALAPEVPEAGSRKVAALIALRTMGTAATPALAVAVLNTDEASAARIAQMLGENPDARALPPLTAVMEDPTRPLFLRKAAAESIERIASLLTAVPDKSGKKTMPAKDASEDSSAIESANALIARVAGRTPNAASAFYLLAQRYYYSDPTLLELTPVADRVLWRWNAQGKDFATRLVPVATAPDTYAPLAAQDLILTAMRQKYADLNLLELYVSNKWMLIEQFPADAGDPESVQALNESLGADCLYLSLGRALRDRNAAMARRNIAALRQIGDPRPRKENSLISALAYPDKFVRASAAETIMHLSPTGDWGGTDEVVRVMAAGLGARVRGYAVLLTQDERLARRIDPVLRDTDMVPQPFDDSVQAIHRTKEMLPAVNLMLIDTRMSSTTLSATLESVCGDSRSSSVPILLLTPPEEADKLRAAIKGVGIVAANAELAAIKAAVLDAVKTAKEAAASDVRENAELVTRILNTLATLPACSKYPAQPLADSAALLLQDRPDNLRILALRVIANLAGADQRDRVYALFVNAGEPIAVRREAGAALLKLLSVDPGLPQDQREAVRLLTLDSDAILRAQATFALSLAATPLIERESRVLQANESVAAPAPTVTPSAPEAGKPAGK